ncbi:hypothetical protein DAPPUDRAFT_250561 [Daphnia pulex]|uniref:Uncharacterized protein n=1 Tax=Daphnia pulex TaxID=6669 RepID=E9GYU0_DAPPU|nr:hypothetical protein DAPPUDRAFT_250561 [Daphnia pulex]|eukprot:EFX75352.1 hypothetical protein DAPPUDRAFT_250561 [Daphnia pulex]
MDESKVSSVSFPVLLKHLLPSLLPKRRMTMIAEQFEEDDHPQVEKFKATRSNGNHYNSSRGFIYHFQKAT